jgi:molybdenum cofactor biosynthesis enzyme MoaA|tara:strand:+ start:1112 stop:1285 length:174 start_codon:yes stop_codon:yes gene_type:complete
VEDKYCPYHNDEELIVIEKYHKGFCEKCRRIYLFSKIKKLGDPKLKLEGKPRTRYEV